MEDVTPQIPSDRLLVGGYFDGGFKIAGRRHRGSLLLRPERVEPWPVASLDEVTANNLAPILEDVEILILGTGDGFALCPPDLRAALKEQGVSVEAMATPAACRTYNVLVAEERHVAAALIALPAKA